MLYIYDTTENIKKPHDSDYFQGIVGLLYRDAVIV
jgi:hypothetical protein